MLFIYCNSISHAEKRFFFFALAHLFRNKSKAKPLQPNLKKWFLIIPFSPHPDPQHPAILSIPSSAATKNTPASTLRKVMPRPSLSLSRSHFACEPLRFRTNTFLRFGRGLLSLFSGRAIVLLPLQMRDHSDGFPVGVGLFLLKDCLVITDCTKEPLD